MMEVAADTGVVVVVVDDMQLQCSNHPYNNSNNNPGGICAFCLQEKLGRLVSSSKSDPCFFPVNTPSPAAAAAEQHQNNKLVMLKRSKSTAASTTRRIISHEPRHQIFDNDDEEEESGTNEYSPAAAKSATRNKHHRGFWSSFLHLTSASNRSSKRTVRSSPRGERDHRDRMAVLSNTTATDTNSNTISSTIAGKEKQLGGGNESTSNNGAAAAASSTGTRDTVGGYGDENDSPNSSSHASSSNSFGRKVARSRSVGCGSRSFSGAFLEKISTGFGDCSTLRRVESQRESSTTNNNYHNTNNKMMAVDDHHRRNHRHHHIKERVKCGGIFGGFTMANTSNNISNGGRVVAAVVGPPHGRSRNWGWAFASPMGAFRPPTSSSSSSSKPDSSVVAAAAPKDIWVV